MMTKASGYILLVHEGNAHRLGDYLWGKSIHNMMDDGRGRSGLWGIDFGLAVPLNIAVGERLDKAKHEGILRIPLRQAYVDGVN